MTITLDLTPEEEENLRQKAARARVTPEEYLRRPLARPSRTPKPAHTEPKPQYKNLAEQFAAILGPPNLEYAGTNAWSEVEAACDDPQ